MIYLLIINTVFIYLIVEYLIGWKSLISNIKEHGFKYLTKDRASLILDWAYIKKNGIHLKPDQIYTFSENVMFRRIMCEECEDKGKCVNCGCDFKGLVSTPSATCSVGRWPKMILDEKQWRDFLNKNARGIKFGFVRDGKK